MDNYIKSNGGLKSSVKYLIKHRLADRSDKEFRETLQLLMKNMDGRAKNKSDKTTRRTYRVR